jgi:hypothetical protein
MPLKTSVTSFFREALRALIVIGVLCICATTISAQEGALNVGFGAGEIGFGSKAWEEEIRYLNTEVYPGWVKPIKHSGVVRGVSIEYMHGKFVPDSWYFFWNWSNHHLNADGAGKRPETSGPMKLRLKYRFNHFTLGTIGYRTRWNMGIAYCPADIGMMRVLLKRSYDKKFIDYYSRTEASTLAKYTVGSSFHLDYCWRNQLLIRASYYHAWDEVVFRDREYSESPTTYTPSRFSIALHYMLFVSR